ncbi:TonB-dependent receptor [Flavimarina sp. Hel_I_48]|uniref:TonB-dependent receptor n=1 Tax=Flavimarina sp. Hel_I_48 TaxID=1392488 RepID=UPI0004DF1337|nr:TonB-dependent receptor [Flavimarina sp. Hel_I_48]
MKKITSLMVLACLLMSFMAIAQGKITGTVVDDQRMPLPGVNVIVNGTTNGTTTNFDGEYTLNVAQSNGTIRVSYVGFKSQEIEFQVTSNQTVDLGTTTLSADADALDEVVVTGVVDIAKDRKTPVAVSTIRAAEIQEKLGAQEFPEILNNTPSIYATKQGGGFGDARINIRGFDTRNSAVMINGIPVNDMENGSVYWSNWAGLSDVASAIQVQRGLGSSKLTVSSVGGTINVVTRSADREEGGFASSSVGNNDYLKTVASYNTGLSESGWSGSFLFSRTAGTGYVDGTSFEGYNYYIGVGFRPNATHDFNFMVTGAPQQHNQRSFAPSIADYIRYGNGVDPRIKYNSDYGLRNGKEFTFGGNFYHKPIASLSWDWKISDKSKLNTSAYASLGRGGSIGSIGRIDGGQSFQLEKVNNGLVPIDGIFAFNSGQGLGLNREGYNGGDGAYQGAFVNGNSYPSPNDNVEDGDHIYGAQNGISQRSSVNSHNWFGLISNFETMIGERLTLDFGIDLRQYTGFHYRRLVDLMGADVYVDNDNVNDPYRFLTKTYAPTISNSLNVFKSIDDEEKIDYYSEGKVGWYGFFTQAEYDLNDVTLFVQGSLSNQGFQRIDEFLYLDSNPIQETDVENRLGGNIKGGINWNIDEKHNVFANGGYYSKQPLFDAVYPNNQNILNVDLENEEVIGTEIGYGFRTNGFRANLNAYRTSWANRYETTNTANEEGITGSANVRDITQVHYGVELDFTARPTDRLGINGMLSVGDWEYKNDVTAFFLDNSSQPLLDANGNQVTEILPLNGVKVGDAAQLTAAIGADYRIYKTLSVDANYRFADNLYAAYDATDVTEQGALKLPSFGLLDAGLSFNLPFLDKNMSFRFNMNNILDKTYISESDTNVFADAGDPTYDGISTSNRVYFGFGRTWNASFRFNF